VDRRLQVAKQRPQARGRTSEVTDVRHEQDRVTRRLRDRLLRSPCANKGKCASHSTVTCSAPFRLHRIR
jgi:hypothetical protein